MTTTEIFFATLANGCAVIAWIEHQRYQRLDTDIRDLAARYDRSDR